MNRHDKRRALAKKRSDDRKATKIAKGIGKAAEMLAKQWVTDGIEQMKGDVDVHVDTAL